jgi:S1-C subfamily serine protease
VEFDETEQLPGPEPARRFHTRVVLAALIAVVAAAAAAAGLAFAKTGPSPIGSGVVVIDTNLAYQGGQAAGTGMVLTSSGEVLTNNHVIRGATQIKIVLPSTGRSYTARVVGYDVADDVAVLQAGGASNLKTVSLGNSDSIGGGESVTALGNAGGTGSFTAASGTVTGVGRSITVSDDQGGSEHLSGLIETNAHVQPGDSGGPLLNSSGQVIGMDTAASVSNGMVDVSSSQGYAIPINKALSIAQQIEGGQESSSVHIGGTAFLGVEVTANSYGGSGAAISQVVSNGPAADAGLVPGDVITSFAGQDISSPDQLSAIVATQKLGAPIAVTFVDQGGSMHTTNIALGSGPAR